MKSNGLLLLLGLTALGGGVLLTRKASGESDDKPARQVAWTFGPGGEGRQYGTPDLDVPPRIYSSNVLLIDPSCGWLVEGEGFLPLGDTAIKPAETASTLVSAIGVLETGTAWPFVKLLIGTDKLTPQAAALRILNEAAAYSVVLFSSLGVEVPTGSCGVTPTPNVSAWLADTAARIERWVSLGGLTPARAQTGGARR